jgi:hypothetical protein
LPGHGSNLAAVGVGAIVGLAVAARLALGAGVMLVDDAADGEDDDREPMSRTVSPQLVTTSASAKNKVVQRTFTAYPWTTTLLSRRC